MQYILTENEYAELKNTQSSTNIVEPLRKQLYTAGELVWDLRRKVMELARFTCFHDLEDDVEREEVEEGYCDRCPLSPYENPNKEHKYLLCGKLIKKHSK